MQHAPENEPLFPLCYYIGNAYDFGVGAVIDSDSGLIECRLALALIPLSSTPNTLRMNP